MPLDQCLRDEDYPETTRLARCQNLKLSLIADRKGDESHQAYKFNEEKTLSWLQKKVERVAEILRQKGVHVSQGAVSATYVKSSKYETGTDIGKKKITKITKFKIWVNFCIGQFLLHQFMRRKHP